MSSSLSYPFTPIEINGKTVLRPMLRIILTYNSIDFPTWILVDPRSLNDLVSILKCGREEIKPILKDLMENDKISLSQGKYQSN